MKTKQFLCALLLMVSSMSYANNILVSNASLSGQNTTTHIVKVNFDVSWENSWRTSTNENNYDGAWIFVKFRKNSTSDWRHATLSNTVSAPASGAAFSIPADGKGAFIHRASNGIGNVNYIANQLQWNYSVDGLLDNETVEIKVFGLEMVYIPSGSFLLGSGGNESSAFSDGTGITPFLVTNSTITFGTVAGQLNPNGSGPVSGSLPAVFPKGFDAFWIMKYECSQQQYADFLNHIDAAKATANLTGGFSGIHPNYSPSQAERGIGAVGFQRTAAHADWTGLRPLSELEYEKACRGFNTPAVANEYAWGNTTIIPLSTVTDQGLSTETVQGPLNANANIASGYAQGITRVGIFARSSGSDRSLSGGTYYGVMNMGDNLHEVCVTINNAAGRLLDASVHGNGSLAANGNSDISIWTNNQAYGHRGGSYNSAFTNARISDRQNTNTFFSFPNDFNNANFGIRLVRTAP